MKAKIIFAVLLLIVIGGVVFAAKLILSPTQTDNQSDNEEAPVQQLSADKHPKISLQFTSDAHYVDVSISNLHAGSLEYDIIYDATVKNNRIQTGVNAMAKIPNQKNYSRKQLLGSESSGKFTYHTDIQNAVLNLTLRDQSGRSVFQASYPFSVAAGTSLVLTPQ